jgi:hypothetical protein
MTRLQNAIEMAEHDVMYEANRLAMEAKHLSDRMAKLAHRAEEVAKEMPLDHRGKHYSGINSLGEVQGLGHDVDRFCAALTAKMEKLNTLKYVAKDEQVPLVCAGCGVYRCDVPVAGHAQNCEVHDSWVPEGHGTQD